MEDPTPFFMGGGAKHSPEVVRQFIHDSTSGAEGISLPNSMRVTPAPAPDNTLRVLPGGGLLNNRYPGGSGQSYSVRNATQTTLTTTATPSGSGRHDMVVARVLDPQYEGQPPADPNTFKYFRLVIIEGVAPDAGWEYVRTLPYPAIPLARIYRPASTATVTAENITDLRQLANPIEKSVSRTRTTLYADGTAGGKMGYYADARGEQYPDAGGAQYIDIPSWAVRMRLEATWVGVGYPANLFQHGEYWMEYGIVLPGGISQKFSTHRFRWDAPGGGSSSRTNWEFADEFYIPKELIGKNQVLFTMRARRAVQASESPVMDVYSGIKMVATFIQVPDLSDS